ncbi:MAG: hypothetical protein JSU87_01120 [Gemmatimonadota bacterium]|nr:MAG: hypothetical protein JSU87_01120 [Gemmatimonadota bacterium]
MDRYLWCPACRNEVRRHGIAWARGIGIVACAGLATYLLLRVHPSRSYLPFYLIMLAMTYLLISRIAMAVVQGYYRARGRVVGVESRDEESGS